MPQRPSLPRAFCQYCGLYVPIYRTYMRGLPRLLLNLTVIGFLLGRGATWHCSQCGRRMPTPGRLMDPNEKANRRMARSAGRAIRKDIRKLLK